MLALSKGGQLVFSDPIFLFLFLPISLILIIGSVRRFHSASILLLSLGFYYWTSGWIVFLLIASILANWACGLAITRWRERRNLILYGGIVANLLSIGYFKYSYFIAQNIDFTLGLESSGLFEAVVLPIGISFFTFQGISYLIDVWREEVEAEPNPIRFGAYLAFFPQLIAGPIVRYHDVYKDFMAPKLSVDNFSAGAVRFIHGLIKKVLVADMAGAVADACFGMDAGELSTATALLGAFAYTVQIYFDFSGYSDMAIGIGRMCGIRFQENFRHPYTSSTITEFWRRWHISLSSWFRDYLYIPLGGSRMSTAKIYRNLMIVFLVTGVWHGAAWTYIFWGVYHGLFLIGERVVLKGQATEHTGWVMRLCYQLPVVIIGWVFFRAESLPEAFAYLGSMVQFWQPGSMVVAREIMTVITPLTLLAFVIGAGSFLMPRDGIIGPWLMRNDESVAGEVGRLGYVVILGGVALMLAAASSFSPFLYFQF